MSVIIYFQRPCWTKWCNLIQQ